MCAKSNCDGAKMTAIAQARGWANALVQRESRGNGDTENAMRRLESRYGIPWRTFWTLRYRPPSEIFQSTYERLSAAYQAECDRQMRLLKHEMEITRLTAPDHPAIRAAEALACEDMK